MQFTTEDANKYLSRLDKAALLLLSENSASPINGNTAFQKQIFFIGNYDEEIGDEADFEPYDFGPYSEAAEISMDNLISYGLAKKDGGKYRLTSVGKSIADFIKANSDIDSEEIAEVKDFFTGLDEDEFILFTYVLHPSYANLSKIKGRVLNKRLSLSISMYNKEKVDLEMASHLANLSIENFLDKIRVAKGAI